MVLLIVVVCQLQLLLEAGQKLYYSLITLKCPTLFTNRTRAWCWLNQRYFPDLHIHTVMLTVLSFLLQLWLELARTFLALQQIGDAQYCVQQAKSTSPGSPAVNHMEGHIFQVSI